MLRDGFRNKSTQFNGVRTVLRNEWVEPARFSDRDEEASLGQEARCVARYNVSSDQGANQRTSVAEATGRSLAGTRL